MEQGLQNGVDQRALQQKVEIAKKMLLEQCDITLIQKVTGLMLDDICFIQIEMNAVQ